MADWSLRCAACGRRAPTRNEFGVCGRCMSAEVDDDLGSVFDDDLASEKDQIAEMRGLVE